MTQSTYAQRREAVLATAVEYGRMWNGVVLEAEPGSPFVKLIHAVRELDATALEMIVDSDGSYVVGSPETSRRAAQALFPKSGSIRRKVLNDIWNRHDGLASDEMIERSLSGKHQTISSARNHLMNAGWLEDSRLRTAEKKAVLWQLTEAAKRHIREEMQ